MRQRIYAGSVSTTEHRVIVVGARRSVRLSLKELTSDSGIDLFPEIEARGYFSIQFQGKELQLTAGSYVGLIPINPRITIDVRPKLPVSNLARVIELSQLPLRPLRGIQRDYVTEEQPTISILEFLAQELISSLQELDLHGYHKSYVPRTENTSHPRGRIDIRQTALLNFSRGIRHKLITRRFNQTTDTLYNRVLKWALLFLAERFIRNPLRDRQLMTRLNSAISAFESVATERTDALIRSVDSDLRRNRLPQSRQYYEQPLRIALTILAGNGVSLVKKGEEVELSSYVVNFDDVFEEYIRAILRSTLPRKSFRVRDGNKEARKGLFDDVKHPPAQPDIVVDSVDSGRRVIAEVKYKEKVDRGDLNQAITYAASYRARDVMLVHQCLTSASSGRHRLGAIDSRTVYAYGFDLNATDLSREEQAFADSVAALLA